MNTVQKKLVPELRFEEFAGDWNLKSISETSETITSGSRDWAKYYSKGGAIFIRMTNLNRNGISLLLDNLKYVSLPNKGSEGKRTSLKEDDILISITAELGKIGLIPDNLGEAYINQHTALVRPDKEKINATFLAYKLSTKKSNKKLNRLNDSGAKAGLNLSTIRKFSYLLPCKKEQKEIANFLTAVDQRISLLKQKQATLEQYKKGLMQKIFSQEIRFKEENGEDYSDWEVKRLGDICFLQSGFAFKSAEFKTDGIPIVRISNLSIQDKYLNKKEFVYFDEQINFQSFEVIDGDLLLAMSGATAGKACIFNLSQKAYLNQRVGLFKSRVNICYEYLIQYVFSELFLKQLQATLVAGAQPNISSKEIEMFKIKLPNQKEQQKIADYLSSLDQSINKLKSQIEQTIHFKKGLLQKMFV